MKTLMGIFLISVILVQTKQDQVEHQSYQFQTNYDNAYNQQLAAADTYSQYYYGNQEKQDSFGGYDMNMVSMGASMISAVVALGALAYAFTLEARILTNDARSLSTCEALNTITSNTLTSVPAVTTTDCTIATTGDPTVAEIIACINALQTDINSNIVTPINAYGNPTC